MISILVDSGVELASASRYLISSDSANFPIDRIAEPIANASSPKN